MSAQTPGKQGQGGPLWSRETSGLECQASPTYCCLRVLLFSSGAPPAVWLLDEL